MSAPPLVDYALEKQLGVQLAYQIHNLGMLSADHALQHVATDVGNPILDNWPFRLRGYNYRFFVLDSDDIDAIGLPSGLVYLNRGLLESVESDAELEVIVAHEIARTEQRYGLEVYKQLENDRRNAVQNTLVAGMSAALVSKGDYRVKNALTAGLGAGLVSHLVYKVLHEGYPRGLEYEADAITLFYLCKRYGQQGMAAMSQILRKRQYYADYFLDEFENKEFRSSLLEPLMSDRIMLADNTAVHYFEQPMKYSGYSKGEVIITVSLFAQVVGRFPNGFMKIMGEVHSLNDSTQQKLNAINFRLSDNSETPFQFVIIQKSDPINMRI